MTADAPSPRAGTPEWGGCMHASVLCFKCSCDISVEAHTGMEDNEYFLITLKSMNGLLQVRRIVS